jgi:hypothetical protein
VYNFRGRSGKLEQAIPPTPLTAGQGDEKEVGEGARKKIGRKKRMRK